MNVNGGWDTVNNTEKRIKFIQRFAELTLYAKMFDIKFIVTDFHRTVDRQQKLYAAGKSQCDGINNKSKHQSWLAEDICIVKDGGLVWNRTDAYELLGTHWKKLGGIWGGDFDFADDIYHFEAGFTEVWHA